LELGRSSSELFCNPGEASPANPLGNVRHFLVDGTQQTFQARLVHHVNSEVALLCANAGAEKKANSMNVPVLRFPAANEALHKGTGGYKDRIVELEIQILSPFVQVKRLPVIASMCNHCFGQRVEIMEEFNPSANRVAGFK
jgi:hypothetical protein